MRKSNRNICRPGALPFPMRSLFESKTTNLGSPGDAAGRWLSPPGYALSGTRKGVSLWNANTPTGSPATRAKSDTANAIFDPRLGDPIMRVTSASLSICMFESFRVKVGDHRRTAVRRSCVGETRAEVTGADRQAISKPRPATHRHVENRRIFKA